jgi:hypothetical protein
LPRVTLWPRRILLKKDQDDLGSARRALLEPFALTPGQREELLKIIGVSEISDEDWAFLEIGEAGFRRVTRAGWVIEHEPEPRASKQVSRSLQRIAKAARLLRDELLSLPKEVSGRVYLGLLGAGNSDAIDRFAVQFNRHLDLLSGGNKRARSASNAEKGRDEAWRWAASWYERVSGQPMGTVERRDREGRRLEPDNPSIRFIKAFTEACGAPVPSGDTVNNWIKKYLEGRPPRRRGRPRAPKDKVGKTTMRQESRPISTVADA